MQSPEELSAHLDRFSEIQGLMELFLDKMEEELEQKTISYLSRNSNL